MSEYRQELLATIGKNVAYESMSRLDWHIISFRKNLEEEFLLEFANELDWDVYLSLNTVSFEIIKKYILKIKPRNIFDVELSHLTNNQRKEIRKIINIKYMFHNKSIFF